MKKIKITIMLVLFLLLVSIVTSEYIDDGTPFQNVNDCGTLTTNNAVYNLTNNITINSSCFNIQNINITINGNSYTLNSTNKTNYNWLPFLINQDIDSFLRIENITIMEYGHGIYPQTARNMTIKNCTVNSSSTALGGVIINSTILDSYFSSIVSNPLQLVPFSVGNYFENNTFDGGGTYYNAIIQGNDNKFINNIFKNSVQTDAIYTSNIYVSSSNNLFRGGYTNVSNSYSVRLNGGASNNNFYDMQFYKANDENINSVDNSVNNSFINCTYSNESITGGNILRKWYFDIEVNYTEGYLENANVTIYNFSSFVNSQLTGTKGNTTRLELTEYVNNGTKNYYSNIINISKTGYITNSTTLNLTKTNNTYLFVTLIPTLSVNIAEPKAQTYSSNLSLELNFSITNYSTISTCWYSIFNSTSGYEKANTTIPCSNTTFNVSKSDTYTLFIYVNESSGINASDSVTFAVSMDSPAIVLNYPINQWFNNKTVYFNFTATDSDGISMCSLWGNWTGTFHKNFTWYNPTNDTMNFTNLQISDTFAVWNIYCNDTANNFAWALNNLTFGVDTVIPIANQNLSVTTTLGSQTIQFLTNISDINLDECNYTIRNLAGTVDGIENKSFECNNLTNATVSSFASYYLYTYGFDKARNVVSQNISFTTSATSAPSASSGNPLITNQEPTKLFSILNTNLDNKLDIRFAKDSVRPRTKTIIFINRANKPLTIDLTCDITDVNKSSREVDICSYVSFKNKTIVLSANENTPTETEFYVTIPAYGDFGESYYFNIIATDRETKQFSKLSVTSEVSYFSTLFYKYSYYPFQDENKSSFPVFLPSFILSMLIFIIVIWLFSKLEKVPLGLLLAFLLFFLSLILFTFYLF